MTASHLPIQQLLKSQWPPRVAIGFILTLFTWWALANVLPMFKEKTTPAPTVKIEAKPKVDKKTSLNSLNLFGAAEMTKSQNKTDEAVPTKLDLTLRGILASDDPKQGIAQIQNAKKVEKHFIVGETVFGIATLEEVYVDRVILLHNGRYETLLLPEEFLNTKHFAAAKLRQERKRVATNYRDIFLSREGSELIKLFGFKPRFRKGLFEGFVVTALGEKGKEMMKTLAVEDGDLIVEVNGLRFSESLEASAQLKDLKDATSVDVIINRNGEEIPFHFEFDERIEEIVDIPDGMTAEEYEEQQILEEPDYGDTKEDLEYIEQQKARRTGKTGNVEFDH